MTAARGARLLDRRPVQQLVGAQGARALLVHRAAGVARVRPQQHDQPCRPAPRRGRRSRRGGDPGAPRRRGGTSPAGRGGTPAASRASPARAASAAQRSTERSKRARKSRQQLEAADADLEVAGLRLAHRAARRGREPAAPYLVGPPARSSTCARRGVAIAPVPRVASHHCAACSGLGRTVICTAGRRARSSTTSVTSSAVGAGRRAGRPSPRRRAARRAAPAAAGARCGRTSGSSIRPPSAQRYRRLTSS